MNTQLKMRDLVEASGLDRQAIHFYIREGLLPPGEKTGRNQARYGDEHIRRLETIRKLQREHFLPLKAIRAVLDDDVESFEGSQAPFLQRIRDELPDEVAGRVVDGEIIDVDVLAAQSGTPAADIDRMAELGFIELQDSGGRAGRFIRAADAWMIELWGRLRQLGFSPELGFTVDDLQVLDGLVQQVVEQEAQWLGSRLADHPPANVAKMVQAALPIISQLLVKAHDRRVRDFWSEV